MHKMNTILECFDELLSRSLKGKPFIYEENGTLSLHFDITAIQSQMRPEAPDQLVLGYTQSMMGFLLFKSHPESIAMIGLGGGSIPKYCHRYLPEASISVVEINPDVIALRDQFCIPKNDERFQVLCEDGAHFVRRASNQFDVLLVDGFDVTGQPAQLCSQRFYDDCHDALTENGIMVVNLCGGDLRSGALASRIRKSFDNAVIMMDSEDGYNKIVFAGKGKVLCHSDKQINSYLSQIERSHPTNLRHTAQHLRQNRHLTRA